MMDGEGNRKSRISQRGVALRLLQYANEIASCGMLVSVSPTASRAALQAVLQECSGVIIDDARAGRTAAEIEALAFPGADAAFNTGNDDDKTTLN